MRTSLLLITFLSFAGSANDFIGIPIGGVVDFEPVESERRAPVEIFIDGPFDGMFSVFDRYKARIDARSGLLIMAEAEKLFSTFRSCADETRRAWSKLEREYGKPTRDENQAWWFDIGNRQKISLDCTIYGASGKIAMNMRVVDSALASAVGEDP